MKILEPISRNTLGISNIYAFIYSLYVTRSIFACIHFYCLATPSKSVLKLPFK